MPDESSGLLSVRRRRGYSADLRHFVFAAFRPPANATQRSAAALCPHRGHGRQWRARFARLRADLSRKRCPCIAARSEEHTSELQSLMRISYAVLCLKKKTKNTKQKQ